MPDARRRLGENVRKHRERLRYSQETLAEHCGLHRTYVGGIERGERNPGLLNLVRIARALGLTTSELLRGVDAERDR